MDFGDITSPDSIPASIDDLIPAINVDTDDSETELSGSNVSDDTFALDDDEDDEFEGFKIDLDTIGEDDDDEDEDDEDDITSLFDSMFDD